LGQSGQLSKVLLEFAEIELFPGTGFRRDIIRNGSKIQAGNLNHSLICII
jgi:hypothetical protein